MDEVTASRFVSLLVKSIQSLCNQCIDFSSSIEVIGHIHLSIDRNAKFNYILTEEVSKSATEGVTIYSSRSYNSQPPPNTLQTLTNTPRQNRRKCSQVPRVDDSDSLYIKSIHTVLPDEESGSDSPSLNEPCEDCDNSSNINVPQSSDSVDINIPQNSDSVDDIKLEKHERAISQIKDKLEANVRRRKSAILTPQIQSSTTKRSRIDDNRSYSKERNMAFDGVEIKKEPSESSPYVKVETSHLAAMEDVQTPDFSSVVIESLDRVDRIEGGLNQQQQQPFPVMLHANSDIPASAVPVSPVSVPGQSIDPKSLPSSGGEMKTRRVIKRKTSTKMVQTGYHTFKGKITAKMQMVAATGKKKSPSKKVNQSSLKTNVKKEKVLSSYDLLKTKPYKGGYREYTEADINEAIELVHGGMPVIDAALKYGIPRATLFNRSRDGCKTHSGRCSEVFGRTHVGGRRRAKAMQYTQEAVEKAIQAVHAGMPVIDASILYHIPRATLFVRSSKGCPSHAGRCATVFSSGKLRRTRAQKIMYRGEQQKQSRHSFSKLENEYYVISPGPGTVPRAAACTATRGQAVTINTEQNAFGNDWTNPEFVKSLFEVPKSTETLYPDKMSEPNVIVETPKPVVVKIEAIDL